MRLDLGQLGLARLGVLALALGAAACNGPDIKDGEIACGVNNFCPPGFLCALDGFCYRDPQNVGPVCGDGEVQGDETCDPPGSCPTSCAPDGNACTTETLGGSAATCNVTCTIAPVIACSAGDACCPAGCDFGSDADCSATCGDGELDEGETCDPIATCPTSCSDGNSCTTDSTTGSVATCNIACGHNTIATCVGEDSCCPVGCTNLNDSDCSASCGNGVIENGETCDPSSSCPLSCSDGNSCTVDTSTGSAANCNKICGHSTIQTCSGTTLDGCCPGGCINATDKDCSVTCGNGVIESGETCDPPSSCPLSCSDGNACTIDTSTGSAANCNKSCGHSSISTCSGAPDGCCPGGCTSINDPDCSANCGNGVIEAGETCDPPGSCPVSCNDSNPCTNDVRTGNSVNCNVVCSHSSISTCGPNESCCPAGCSSGNDPNCSVTCGNGVIESGETCDPPSSCSTIAMMCNDGNACTIDIVTGSAGTCNVVCSHNAVGECLASDGCCPTGCSSTNDNDCGPVMGGCDGGGVPMDGGLGCSGS